MAKATEEAIDAGDVGIEVRVPWQVGDLVGRYSLLAKIAVGGMAEIWLARQAGLKGFEKVVVIKRIVDQFSEDPEFVEMFLDEARIAAQLSHPNIVQIFDLGEHQGAYYIAMEYLPGENLSTLVRSAAKAGRPLPFGYAARIVALAAEGLAHAHGKVNGKGEPLNIVHRDVSPQNIIVTYDGQVKVVDFGIAKATNRASHTSAGKLKGKISYMSPEQARGQPIDGRADVFALGVILYEIVTRSRLFQFDDPMQALNAVAAREPIQSAHARNPEVPEALAEIISRALARAPQDRYPTARNFQTALEDWLRRQDDAPGSTELASFMLGLFRERIEQRSKLLESASQGAELTPSNVRRALKSDTEGSMPGRSSLKKLERPPRSGVLPIAIGAAALAGALAAGGVYLATRAPSQPPQPVAVVAPAKALLAVETDPPGAAVRVDGRLAGNAPVSVADLALGEHIVMAELPGHVRAEKKLTLAQAGEHATIVLSLPAEKAPDPAPNPVQPAVATTTSKRIARGKLTFDTTPWTHVAVDGHPIGDTPLIEVSLPAGTHVLRLTNDDKHLSTSVEIEIKPGQTTTKKLKL